jgi:hypothetical protein
MLDAEKPRILSCPGGHNYTLEKLLLSQALRAESLVEGAIKYLEEQEVLVRGIAERLWQDHCLNAIRLEGQAERIRETIQELRNAVRLNSASPMPRGKVLGTIMPN